MNKHDLIQKGFIEQPDGTFKRDPVRKAQPEIAQRSAARPLDGAVKRIKRGKGRLEVIVGLIDCRRTKLDSDAVVGACKYLRDAIAQSLGYDDGDERVRFDYGCLETAGEPGVIVRIEWL